MAPKIGYEAKVVAPLMGLHVNTLARAVYSNQVPGTRLGARRIVIPRARLVDQGFDVTALEEAAAEIEEVKA
jgi:hypothetical protein